MELLRERDPVGLVVAGVLLTLFAEVLRLRLLLLVEGRRVKGRDVLTSLVEDEVELSTTERLVSGRADDVLPKAGLGVARSTTIGLDLGAAIGVPQFVFDLLIPDRGRRGAGDGASRNV